MTAASTVSLPARKIHRRIQWKQPSLICIYKPDGQRNKMSGDRRGTSQEKIIPNPTFACILLLSCSRASKEFKPR